MSLPIYRAQDDPGPNFAALVSQFRQESSLNGSYTLPLSKDDVRHATTVLAMRISSGVLMAGDRRATEANRIAHRSMEKVFPADSHSAIAIAGAAGPAMEMVKLYQTQLDHFEKVEGVSLSLEGKANQLGQMVANHLGMAMQGLAVVQLFAGYDLRRQVGRIFSYDITGGRYEEADFAATGSGGRDARSVVKMGYSEEISSSDAIRLALRALVEAADEDSATGGVDRLRHIYPIVALVSEDGYHQVDDEILAVEIASLGNEGTS